MPNRIAAVAATVLLLLLGACSSEPEPPRVASIQTQNAGSRPSSPGSSGTDERPVVPLDATDDDIAAITRPWEACLVKEGGTKYKGQAPAMLVKGVEADDPAIAACVAEQPELFEDHLQRTDPTAFKDNQREWYQCAKRQGYRLSSPDPETGQFGLTEIGPDGDFTSPKMEECRRQAFAR
jgi:hypothetical protein